MNGYRCRATAYLWFWGTGKQGKFFSGEQGNKGLKKRGTQVIVWNREHRKSRFCFGGTREQGHFFEGNKGTGTPSPPREGFSCQPDIRSSSIPEKNP